MYAVCRTKKEDGDKGIHGETNGSQGIVYDITAKKELSALISSNYVLVAVLVCFIASVLFIDRILKKQFDNIS